MRVGRWWTRWWRRYADDDGPTTAVSLLLVGLVLNALTLHGTWTGAPQPFVGEGAVWVGYGCLALGCVGVLWRRSAPAVTLGVVSVAFGLNVAAGGSIAMILVLADAVYAAERFGSPRLRAVLRGAIAAALAMAVVAGVLQRRGVQVTIGWVLNTAVVLGIPVWWAATVRQADELAEHARRQAGLEAARADERALRQDAEQAAAVSAERARMARELHDSVAGDVSAVVIRAEAALLAQDGADASSLHAIRDAGLHALTELRSMIEVLHDDAA